MTYDAETSPALTRRRALLGLGAAGATLAASQEGQAQGQTQAPAPSTAPPVTLTLLLVNDIYKMSDEKGRGGFARLAAIVKAERARGVPLLFAHAGDCFSPSLMSGFDQGAHIVELTNLIRPDVFVPGNHEFDFGKETFLKRLGESRYPTYAANLRQADGTPVPGLRDADMVTLGGVKVGVVGLVLENTPALSDPGDLVFSPVLPALREQASRLRAAGADLIVAVAHTERATDHDITRSRLVDVLLTGHDHDLAVGFDGRTVMVESNEEGNYVTAIDLTVSIKGEGKDRVVTWAPAFRVNDSRAAVPDPEVLAKVAAYEAALSKELDVEVAVLGGPLDSRTASVRSGETAVGNLIADAMRAATGAEVAITNGGGIRGNREYPAGHRLTRRDVLSELPFGNRTVVTPVLGRDLASAIENGVSQLEVRGGRFPQVSGLRVEVDRSLPAGARVTRIDVGGAALDQAKTYRVATNDFMLRGGDGYAALGAALAGKDLDVKGNLMANDVMAEVRRRGTVTGALEGRVSVR